MIASFRCKETEALFHGRRVARFRACEIIAMRKPQRLHAAAELAFLRVPPGNRLEALRGSRKDNTASASTTSGAYASVGKTVRRMTQKSLTTTKGMVMREVPLVHPGEILLKDGLDPLGISQYALAKAIGVPRRRINEIVQGKRSITPDTAARLAAFFGVSAESWLALQAHYDAERAREQLHNELRRIPSYTQPSHKHHV